MKPPEAALGLCAQAIERLHDLHRSILLIGTVGVGKSRLAVEAAKLLRLDTFDPEDALREKYRLRICDIQEQIGSDALATQLLDLLIPAAEAGPNLLIPCPPNLACHPDFVALMQPISDSVLLKGLPLRTYRQVIGREIAPKPDYLGDVTNHREQELLTRDAKLFFYHKYWMAFASKLSASHTVRVIGQIDRDSQALAQKILAIQGGSYAS